MDAQDWVHWQARRHKRRATRSPYIHGKGSGSFSKDPIQPRPVRRIGFVCFEDWGEAAWTARDIR